ncbi:dnaJ homolog subfamily C member 1 isoform X2 [Myotis daubentonii]|uniref:dnaJ homolog subfamily C member 1 isoform X2 n=1 Tax=Myotis daubentonii TaxID=98922 RepID=UPI0028730B77|nr:dnaJ homolog subfamily C member 1 isoform X2 [Myotis daubentonii]
MTAPGSRPARPPGRRELRPVQVPPPLLLPLLLLLAAAGPARGWESGDLELFDLVEEVQLNFYQFLGVQQDASSADIRKAYRKLSLTLHPDKNKDENAETQFRQLVAIYEVLKDDERRQRYDDILINGLPDWRQPVFYYRRVRKMSNAELALLLFIILTVGHYAVVWSIYLEKQLDELLSRKKREKKKKTGGKSVDLSKLGASEKNERLLMKPQWHDLLPCKLGIWFCLTLKALPHLIQAPEWTEEDLSQLTRSMVKFPGGTPGRWEKIAHELGRSVTDVTTKAKQLKDSVTCSPGTVRLSELKSTAQHSRPGKATVALPDDIITQREDAQQAAGAGQDSEQEQEEQEAAVPEGQPRRRKPARLPEAAAKAEPEEKFRGKRQKDFDISEQTASSDEESQRKERSRTAEEPWTQNQQKLLELALQQYPKGSSDRWDKIAKCVPSKSKEDCIARYKLLVELVQKKKQAKS